MTLLLLDPAGSDEEEEIPEEISTSSLNEKECSDGEIADITDSTARSDTLHPIAEQGAADNSTSFYYDDDDFEEDSEAEVFLAQQNLQMKLNAAIIYMLHREKVVNALIGKQARDEKNLLPIFIIQYKFIAFI